MPKSFLKAASASLVIFAGLTAAHAADYEPLVVPAETMPIEEYKPVEIGTGWYLRGDVGYGFASSGGADAYRTFSGGTYGTHAWDTARVSKDWDFSVGFGYRFNDWMRTDFTIDRFKGNFNGTTSDPFSCSDPTDTTTTCASRDYASYTAYSLMANAYADLGTFVGITPYVGAGIGVTWVDWGSLTNSTYCVDGTATCGSTVAVDTQHAGYNSARFTWALMAGASYDISQNLKFDLGYKYRRVSGGSMFQFDAGSQATGARGVQGRDTGISSHEVRVGLRYELW